MPAPLGNQNAARGRVWRAAIDRALARREQSRADGIKEIDAIADKLLAAAANGDLAALKELGDRLDGKAAQAIIGDNDSDPINVLQKIERAIVRPQDTDG